MEKLDGADGVSQKWSFSVEGSNHECSGTAATAETHLSLAKTNESDLALLTVSGGNLAAI